MHAGDGSVTFNGTVDGPSALGVQSTGAVTFVGDIGGLAPLDSLWVDYFDTPGSGFGHTHNYVAAVSTVSLPGSITTDGGLGNLLQGQLYWSDVGLGGATTFNATANQLVYLPSQGNDLGGNVVTVTNSSVTLIRDGSSTPFAAGDIKASNTIFLDVTQFKDTTVTSAADAASYVSPTKELSPTLDAPGIFLRFQQDYSVPPNLLDATNFTMVALYNLGPSVQTLVMLPPESLTTPGTAVVDYRFYFTGTVPAGSNFTFTDPVTGVVTTGGSASFPNVDLRVNNTGVNLFFTGLDPQLQGAISAAQQAAAQAAQDEAKKSFGTDSVARQIDFGFVGDVGTSPPMDHRIIGNGISTPTWFEDSRENQACK